MFNTIFPKIHKEGYKFLAISILATFIILFFSKYLGILFILVTIWVYYFFRDPERYSINDDRYLISPADGLITDISEKSGPEELRLENTTYTNIESIKKEIMKAKKTFKKYSRPSIDITRKSVEETDASIIKILDIYLNNVE